MCAAADARAGSISGRVTCAAASCPYEEVDITVFDLENQVVDFSWNGATGSYSVSGLAAGTYKVRFSGYTAGFATEWFRDRTSFKDADAVVVSATGATTGIDADLARLGSISGRVTGDSLPVQGVWVQAFAPGNEREAARASHTAADGTYALRELSPGSYKVSFTKSGDDFLDQWYSDAPTFALAEPVSVGLARDTGGIDAALRHSGTIAGRVSAEGVPLAEAYVEVTLFDGFDRWEAVTDADGMFAVRGLASGLYRVEFRKSGFVGEFHVDKPASSVADVVPLAAPETVVVNADLSPGASLSGTVRAGGVPCAGTLVSAYHTGEGVMGDARTGTDGTYTITGLPSGPYLVYFARGAGCPGFHEEWYPGRYRKAEAEVLALAAPRSLSGIDADLAAGGSIAGKVTGGGAPLSGSLVIVSTIDGEAVSSVRTAADGTYSVAGLPPGPYRVKFSDTPPYAGEWFDDQPSQDLAQTVTVGTSQDATGVDADLALGGSISGTVTSGGVPIVSSVTVWGPDGQQVRGGSSAANGVYSLAALPSGTYKVRFSNFYLSALFVDEWYDDQPSEALAGFVTVTAPQENPGINADLARKGSISGTVRSGGVPLPSPSVSAWTAEGTFVKWATTSSPDGTYRIEGLSSGPYKVRFSPPLPYLLEWYDDQPTQELARTVAVAVSQDTSGIDADIARGGSISGTVTCDGLPVQGASVSAYRLDGTHIRTVTSSANGTYSLAGLAAGSYRVTFSPNPPYVPEWFRGQPTQESADIVTVVGAADTPAVDADLVWGGRISGKVTADGAPVSTALVEVWSLDDSVHRSAHTSYNGSYTINQLPTGSYAVKFTPNRGEFHEEWYDDQPTRESAVPVAVTAPNITLGVDADLGDGGTISGTVTHAGVAAWGVYVQLYAASAEQWVKSAVTDAAGFFRFTALRTGDYKVRVLGGSLTLSNQWYPDRPSHALAESLHVTAPAALTAIDVSLGRAGSICGLVEPGVTVQVVDLAGNLRGSVRTQLFPDYCVDGLPSGSYKVKRVDGGSDTWYINGRQFADAEEVVVAAPFATSGIDILPWADSNNAPVLDPVGDAVVQAGATLRIALTGRDPDGGALTYGVEGLPVGAAFDPAGGTMTWTPTLGQAGWHRVTFRVVDDGSPPLADRETVTVVVVREDWAPSLDPIGDKSVTEGQMLRFTVSGYDFGGEPLTLSSSVLPAGATFGPSSGMFVWRPRFDQAGSYPITFGVADGRMPPGTDSESIVVTVRQPTGAIFKDGFGHAAGADPHWRVLGGSWGVGRGLYGSRSLSQPNVARVLRFDPLGFPLSAGVIQTKVLLTAAPGSRPGAAVVFSLKDVKNYRYIRLLPDRIEVGQAGRLGFEEPGVKKVFRRQLSIGRTYTVKLLHYRSGLLKVYLDGRLVGSHRFERTVPGGVGLAATKARSWFDDFTVWDDGALYP